MIALSLPGFIGLIVILAWYNGVNSHPSFGRIHETVAWDLNVARSSRVGQFLRHHLSRQVLRSPCFPARFKDQPKYVKLGDVQLEWSMSGSTTGWLYFKFWDVDRVRINAVWEFAPCPETNLLSLTRASLPTEFLGSTDRRIVTVFTKDSSPNAIKVAEGQIVFARRTDQTNSIYVLWLKKQERDKLFVQYCIMSSQRE